MAVEGHPVTVQLTSGPDRKPIAGQAVSLVSEYRYSYTENGEKRNGTTNRQIFTTTDEQGLARAFAPVGSLRAFVYTSSWRTESKIDVKADKENRVELHLAQEWKWQSKKRPVWQPKIGFGSRKKGHLSPEVLMANALCLSSFWRCFCGFV